MRNPYFLSPVKSLEVERPFVLAFADELTAFSLRETLWQMEDDNIIEVGDAVVVTRNDQGKVRLLNPCRSPRQAERSAASAGWFSA